MTLFEKRLLLVTGKGGVGRTTTAAVLAQAAANQGKRVCVVELNGMFEVAALYGRKTRSYAGQRLAAGIDHRSLSARDCIDDFGRRKLRVTRLLALVLRSRFVSSFFEAVPGFHDLVQLGKIENLVLDPAQGDTRYDLVILDAPATGHGLTLLAAARSMREMTRVGPFADLARSIEGFLANDAITGLVLTTLPETLPVNETLELAQALGEDSEHLTAVVLNQIRPSALPTTPAYDAVRDYLVALNDPDITLAITLADDDLSRQRDQHQARGRLAALLPAVAGHPVPVLTLPRIPGGRVDPDALHLLASGLERLT